MIEHARRTIAGDAGEALGNFAGGLLNASNTLCRPSKTGGLRYCLELYSIYNDPGGQNEHGGKGIRR